MAGSGATIRRRRDDTTNPTSGITLPVVAAPDLVTVPNVHLCSAGRWEVAVGPEVDPATGHPIWTVTPEQLASIVAAAEDPAIRTPIVKLGHQDQLTEIEMPAVGRIENLRTSDDGLDLYGDLVGVPRWLAEIVASAYPSRSVEVSFDYAASGTDRTHEAVLTALSLLGEHTPAIESLEDIKALYEGEYEQLLVEASRAGAVERSLIKKESPKVTKPKLSTRIVNFWRALLGTPETTPDAAASVSIDTMRSKFYDQLPAGSWAWIREVWNDFIIVDNDDDVLYRIPWSEVGDGDVEFGDPEPVVVQYVEAPASATEDTPIMLARCSSVGPRLSARATRKPEGGHMNTDHLAALGLPEDATDEQISEKLAELTAPATEGDGDTKPAPKVETKPDGTVVVDEETFAELKRNAEAGAQVAQTLAARDRDEALTAAVKCGKIEPARRDFWLAKWESDPEGTKATLDGLAPGLVPVDNAALGHSGNVEAMSDDAIWTALFGADTSKGA